MFFCSKLPSLEGIDLDNYHCYDELEKKSDEVTTIKDYMEKSKMNDFDRLKMIHKNFTNIAASPLYRNDKIWGAVVVDNDFEGAISKKQERIIITYFKIIEKLI
ncbi:hypothetical protein AGMMS50212_15630 [Spirochaetia bacterium]|nr:hypothetical protein AGMMS50212_15630 [Spirochaetia bacterium]